MKAVWKTAILAESDQTVVIEGNHYFTPDSIRREHFFPSEKHTTCPWKGLASYYYLRVGDQTNEDAAWYYAEPKEVAKSIKNHVAFWRDVKVVE
jgi:uncharacterized protein (DUF427 family)